VGTITVTFWGRISDQFGKKQQIDLKELGSISDLRKTLGGDLLKPAFRAIVNGEFIANDAPITDGDEVEFMSPVGGG